MWSDKRRLFLLIGLVTLLGVVYLVVHGVPGWRKSRSADETPAGDVPAARPRAGGGDSADPPRSAREKASARREVVARRREVARIALQKKPEHLPRLKEAADDKDWRVRHAAVDGVGRLGRDGDPKFLIDVLRNRSEAPEVRAAAAERLGEMRFWDAGPALIDAMEDPSTLLRARAGVALRRIMVVDFRYRAGDPPARRREALQRIRELWPWFYERFAQSKDIGA